MNEALWLSLKLSALTTLLLLVIAVPFAYGLTRARGAWKPYVEAVVALPLVLPPTVLGFYLLMAMGEGGWLGRFWLQVFHRPLAFTFTGLLMASVCYSLPFAVQPLLTSFGAIEAALFEDAKTLGASSLRVLASIVLPCSVPGLVSACVLSFAHTMGEFGVALMVGGNIPAQTRTISIGIYEMVEAMRYGEAGKASLLLIGLSYGVLATFYVLNRRVFRL